MHRLRTTFTRSRTPTGAEMKMQNSLEVPKQVRSASFDEMQLEGQRTSAHLLKQQSSSDERSSETGYLQVPQVGQSQRSQSFDSAAASVGSDDSGTCLEVPRRNKSRRHPCIHCVYVDQLERIAEERRRLSSEASDGDNDDDCEMNALAYEDDEDENNFGAVGGVVGGVVGGNCKAELYTQYDDDTAAEMDLRISEAQMSMGMCMGTSIEESRARMPRQMRRHTIGSSVTTSEDEGLGSGHGSPHFGNTLTLPMTPCGIKVTVSSINGNDVDGIEVHDLEKPLIFPIEPFSPPISPQFSFSVSGSPMLELPPPSVVSNQQLTSTATVALSLSLPPPIFSVSVAPGGSNIQSTTVAEVHATANGDKQENAGAMAPPSPTAMRPRRRSISRQEAIFVEPTGNSLENVSHEEDAKSSVDTVDSIDDASMIAACGSPINGVAAASSEDSTNAFVVRDIYLAVPDLRRDRAASVDSCFSKLSANGKTEQVQSNTDSCFLTVPNSNATRSRSVDIVLPTDEQARYKALAMNGTSTTTGAPTGARPRTSGYSSGSYGNGKSTTTSNARRPIRIVPDWSENAIQGEHYWKPTSASGDLCCLNEECIKSGQRMKCSACQLIAHSNCIPIVNDRTQLACKPTYRDVGIRQYREQTTTHHHWVHRKLEKGKCKQCGKAVQGKLFGSKEIVALACAWCHDVYHNKESCFNKDLIGEECRLGNYAPIIVPPSWIVKLPAKGNFKSSIRVSNKNNANNAAGNKKKPTTATKRIKGGRDEKKEPRAFIVKPIPSPDVIPVIVFINPKSGGNQGVKLLGKFQQLLNPRQVFDLTQGGPRMGLEMFRKAPNLRILACGGDGTVGWVLSVLDQLNPPIIPSPPVGVLPLGTGNDLARALGWGGGYTDEPVGKILREIGMSQSVNMDRWRVRVTPNSEISDDQVDRSRQNVPLNVINNYFSFGVDAHIALEFHEAREAHPERFNSRLRNKMYYGQMGGKDLILRQYRNLSQWVTLECDGDDYTNKLRDAGCHAVLFLNIHSYGGGTHPWNDSFGATKPSIEDGMIEVVGLTTYQLPMLQAGLHGTCICQCRTARIITKRTIPMQVDGEACRVKPSIIEIELLNRAVMLAKRKQGRGDVQVNPLEKLQLTILRVTMQQYEQYHYDKDMLRKLANKLGKIELESQCDLEHVRNILNTKFEESITYPKVSQDWCFIDACTAEHYFRIDRAQENLHYICDIASDELYILDHEAATMPQTPDQERSFAAFSQRQAQNERRNMDGQPGHSGHDDDLQIGSKPIKVMKWKSPILEQTSDAVLLAAQGGDLNMLRALHEQGYSLQTVNKSGQTSLHFACKYNHKDIVKYIISCASRRLINMAEKECGQTALHIAAEQNRRDICVMLVAAGANLETRDSSGNTAMMVAFNKNANEIATYLESKQQNNNRNNSNNLIVNDEKNLVMSGERC